MSATVGWRMALSLGGQTIGKAKDVTLTLNIGTAEITVRDDEGWENYVGAMRGWTVEGDALWIPSDAGVAAIETAAFAMTKLAAVVTSPSGKTYTGEVIITSIGVGQPLKDAVNMPFSGQGCGALTPAGGS